MSTHVDVEALAEQLAEFSFAYLMTVGDDERVHTSAVSPVLVEGGLVIEGPSTSVRSNSLARPAISLVWPPKRDDGFSLIVDGNASTTGDTLRITPARAVLHRPAPRPSPATDGSTCVSDCVEL